MCILNVKCHTLPVLISEIVYHYVPKLVELHNYTGGMSKSTKERNWQLLNKYVSHCKQGKMIPSG